MSSAGIQNISSIAIGIVVIIAVMLLGYWFWVPDIGAMRTWDEFLALPTMRCTIGDSAVEGFSGVMYIDNGRLRANYKIESSGVTSRFSTIVLRDRTAYTWADTVNYAERSTFTLGEGSAEDNLFKISRCSRVWSLNPDFFEVPLGIDFHERGK